MAELDPEHHLGHQHHHEQLNHQIHHEQHQPQHQVEQHVQHHEQMEEETSQNDSSMMESKVEAIYGETDAGSADVDESAIDTTEEFLKVFQGKTDFDSWEEFSNLFEEFQRVTGSSFKPRSATSIEYANERRAKDKIADRFVYQTVKMVCQNYGQPMRKEGSTRKTKKYVGLGCEAMVHLRYKQGSLCIVSCNLEHKNHSLHSGNEIISVRSFTFTDDVDFLIAKVTLEHNPYNSTDQDQHWSDVVSDLQIRDPNLKTVNTRMVKKRVRFLIDRYMANINGKAPLPDDEMGIILYELAQSKQDSMDNPRPRGRPKKRRVGRPRKYRHLSDDDDDLIDDEEEYETKPRRHGNTKSTVTAREMSAFLSYLQRKDETDRALRQKELDLRREELELHKKEMELHKSKFEFDRVERQVHLDLLKAQMEAFTGKPGKPEDNQAKGAEGITEYTIVVNNEDAFGHHAQQHVVQ